MIVGFKMNFILMMIIAKKKWTKIIFKFIYKHTFTKAIKVADWLLLKDESVYSNGKILYQILNRLSVDKNQKSIND